MHGKLSGVTVIQHLLHTKRRARVNPPRDHQGDKAVKRTRFQERAEEAGSHLGLISVREDVKISSEAAGVHNPVVPEG